MLHKFLVMFLLVATAVALAQPSPQVLVATGKEVHSATTSPGVVVCEGGQPSTQGPPCSPGTKQIWIWNVVNVSEYTEVAGPAAAYLKGKNTTVVHCKLDQNYVGLCWGTFEWEVPEMGGRWEGTWFAPGERAKGISINSASGYGYGGKLEGLQLKFDAVNPGGLSYSIFIARVHGS
jgi:hypothetical protein